MNELGSFVRVSFRIVESSLANFLAFQSLHPICMLLISPYRSHARTAPGCDSNVGDVRNETTDNTSRYFLRHTLTFGTPKNLRHAATFDSGLASHASHPSLIMSLTGNSPNHML